MSLTANKNVFDIYVIGGGINGVGIAVDAAGRGLKVGLCDKGDLAGATSSASSKLIHGGLRYLEHLEFRLVKEALAEREVLLKLAPHIARPMRFCLPHRPQLRPKWMIRAGLFLYDHLSGRATLPGCHSFDFSSDSVLHYEFKSGFEFSDVWIDDARLVILNAMKLAKLGGEVNTRTKVVDAYREGKFWHLRVIDQLAGTESVIKSRALVNAAGPWVKNVMDKTIGELSPRNIRLIKGSHIIVPRIHDENRAYILQNPDKRIVFVIPYLETFSLIGTTDVEYKGDPSEASCSRYEIDYLCKIVNEHFRKQINPSDVLWTYSGVRPLCEDESDSPQAITRDYTIELSDLKGEAPLLSVFGGKLTTFRKLGEAAVDKLARYFSKIGPKWTVDNFLPGSEGVESAHSYASELIKAYPWLLAEQAGRLSTCYGSLAHAFLKKASSFVDLGKHFGAGLTSAEVDYLMMNEWARDPDDVLWRRSKLGLFMDKQQQFELSVYMEEKLRSIQQV